MTPMAFDMWLLPTQDFLEMSTLRPHQELMREGKLQKYSPSMDAIFFISHQWTSFDHPDHSSHQLHTMQQLLRKMLRGKCPQTAPSFIDAAMFSTSVKITPSAWRKCASKSYVWIDFASVPQMGSYHDSSSTTSDLVKAVNSIPACEWLDAHARDVD